MSLTLEEELQAQAAAIASGYLQNESRGLTEAQAQAQAQASLVIAQGAASLFATVLHQLAALHSQIAGPRAVVPGTAEPEYRYRLERAEFQRMLPELLRTHAGRFVMVHDGQVWGADTSRNVLVRRFFAQHAGGTPVHIGFVGPRPVVHLPTPFRRRS